MNHTSPETATHPKRNRLQPAPKSSDENNANGSRVSEELETLTQEALEELHAGGLLCEEWTSKKLERELQLRRNKVYLVGNTQIALSEFDLSLLNPGVWLNDEIVNGYLSICTADASDLFCFHSTFIEIFDHRTPNIPVSRKRWLQKSVPGFDTSSTYSLLVFPINILNQHWTLLLVDVQFGSIWYLDSLAPKEVREPSVGNKIVNAMEQFLRGASRKWDHPWNRIFPRYIVRQTNLCDCGVYICSYARRIVEYLFETKTSGNERRCLPGDLFDSPLDSEAYRLIVSDSIRRVLRPMDSPEKNVQQSDADEVLW